MICLFYEDSFLSQLNFVEIIGLLQRRGKSGHPLFFDVVEFKTVLSVCIYCSKS